MGAVVIVVVGVLQTWSFISFVMAGGYDELAAMIYGEFDEDKGREPFGPLRIGPLVRMCIFASGVMALVGSIGLLATCSRSRLLLCMYFAATSVLAVLFFCVWAFDGTLARMLGPVLRRQMAELCNPVVHRHYWQALACHDAADFQRPLNSSQSICGANCRSRVEILRRMGGCGLLERLCHHTTYRDPEKSPSSCVAPRNQSRLAAFRGLSLLCCEAACDAHIGCAGFAHDEQGEMCMLESSGVPILELLIPDLPCGEWPGNFSATFFPVSTDVPCRCRAEPRLVGALRHLRILGFSCACAAASLLGATICACYLQYALATGMTSKQEPCTEFAKLLSLWDTRRDARCQTSGYELATAEDEEDSEGAGSSDTGL